MQFLLVCFARRSEPSFSGEMLIRPRFPLGVELELEGLPSVGLTFLRPNVSGNVEVILDGFLGVIEQ